MLSLRWLLVGTPTTASSGIVPLAWCPHHQQGLRWPLVWCPHHQLEPLIADG